MFRTFKPNPRAVNIILMNGGVGDHIGGSLIAINYMVRRYPWITFLLWMPDFLIDFAENVLPKGIHIKGYSDMLAGYDRELPTKTTKWDGVMSPMKIHQVDYAFLKLCDELPSKTDKSSLKVNLTPVGINKFNLPSKYVVITTGYTAEVREFIPNSVCTLISYVKSKGYTPVFLGQKQTATGGHHVIQGTFDNNIPYSKGVNLCDKTTLLQAAKIMAGAKAVIGVDNGLLHVAACTDVPIVAGYTTVLPSKRVPYRDGVRGKNWYPVVPDKDLACRFCQSNTNFLYEVNYTKCFEKDLACVKQMTATKFIAHLSKIL